jgi:hypothetical protein
LAVAGRYDKWTGLDDQEDRVWRAVLAEFAAAGRAPDVAKLASMTRLAPRTVDGVLDRLRARDLVLRANESGAITVAYPFCEWSTGHRVRWDGQAVEALCAIDALGMGAMLGRDTVVEAGCRHCGEPIRVATRQHGTEIAAVAPEATIVWAGIAYAGNCGATSGCKLKVFFCCDEHLQAWRAAAPAHSPGFRLSVDEAHQVGRAIFARCCGCRQPLQGGRHDVQGNARDRHRRDGRCGTLLRHSGPRGRSRRPWTLGLACLRRLCGSRGARRLPRADRLCAPSPQPTD